MSMPAAPQLRVCTAAYAASLAVFFLTPLGHHWGFVDLSVYREGGRAILDGTHLYLLRFPGALAFTYPPLAALAFTGLVSPPMALVETLLTAGSLALLPLMLFLALRIQPMGKLIARRQAVGVALLGAAAALWLEPVWTTLRYGQIDVLIATLIVWDLGRPRASRWTGMGIGLATGLKLTPAIFVAYLLLGSRYRAAARACAVFAGTVAVGFVLAPGDSSEFWGGDFLEPKRVGRIENTANQTLRGAAARLLHSANVEAWWLASAAVVGVIGMALAVRAARRGDDVSGFSLCALTGLLVSPISWSHHWVLAIPALLLLAVNSLQRSWRAGIVAAALAAAVGCSHVIWWVPVNHPPHSELHLSPLRLLCADAYVLLALGALAVVACGLGYAKMTSDVTPLQQSSSAATARHASVATSAQPPPGS